MKLTEIFVSVQGEGRRVGEPTVFVRLAGCNLRCVWCDTDYAWQHAEERSLGSVVEEVLSFDIGWVCVTGGEPLLEPQTPLLIKGLLDRGLGVTLMTNGSLSLAEIPAGVHKVVDIKTPWAHGRAPEQLEANLLPPHLELSNLGLLQEVDDVKFVVRNRQEFEWAVAFIRRAALLEKVGAVFISPAWGLLEPSVLAEWILEKRLPIRLHLQLHKIVFGVDTRR